MNTVEQGDILQVSGVRFPVIVVSNNFFNRSGMAVVCPILSKAAEGPLHIRLQHDSVDGYVLCEQVRFVDFTTRHFSRLTSSHYFDIMDISDAVMGIFDYQQL